MRRGCNKTASYGFPGEVDHLQRACTGNAKIVPARARMCTLFRGVQLTFRTSLLLYVACCVYKFCDHTRTGASCKVFSHTPYIRPEVLDKMKLRPFSLLVVTVAFFPASSVSVLAYTRSRRLSAPFLSPLGFLLGAGSPEMLQPHGVWNGPRADSNSSTRGGRGGQH